MLKRLFDITLASLALIFLSPILILVIFLIRIDSSGPAFFRQKRVGMDGKVFTIHKFRTMVTDAEAIGAKITIGSDPRVTKIGDTLRKTKLDELPQLFNVLIGEMSLVGPRPEVPEYVDYYPEEAKKIIFSVRPGITDHASIRFRSENDLLAEFNDPAGTYIREVLPIKIRYQIEYVDSRTFFGDIKIILATVWAVFGK